MLVLGVESSCDETAAAVIQDGRTIRSNIISSQVEVHRPYGGVVPELASRHHIRNITVVISDALAQAGVSLADLDGVAVTRGPGLVGALLVGIQAAKAMAFAARLPLIGINHLEGHLTAPRLVEADDAAALPDRHVALLVSGGHTALIMVEGFGEYRLLGASRDDAAGEAFDKVAKLLGLGYPGGPIIEELARDGDAKAIRFPRALPGKDMLDFSFSGLKTSVANHVRRNGSPAGQDLNDLCASFQQAVCDVLVKKACQAVRLRRAQALVAGGGVLANGVVRQALEQAASEQGFKLFIPPVSLCTDNAAMIAAAGTRRLARGERSPLDLNAEPRLRL